MRLRASFWPAFLSLHLYRRDIKTKVGEHLPANYLVHLFLAAIFRLVPLGRCVP